MGKTLVLYVFHEINERVYQFINKSLFFDENVDFIFISNNKNNIFEVPAYVKILFRENKGFDFGGWSDALLNDELYKNYNHFIFVNSSVIGPFIPSYYKGKWTDIYIDGLKNNVKLFGSTINMCEDPVNKSHIQSYIFAMDKITLEYLIKCKIFSTDNYIETFYDAIWKKEVLMSRKIIENGWNIGSLLPYYDNQDFTCTHVDDYKCKHTGDFMYKQCRYSLWNEYQLVFIKGNRM